MRSTRRARTGLPFEFTKEAWALQTTLLEYLERIWREPDEGIWEIRGERRHFVHSKVMAWVAFDRAVRTVGEHGLDGPVERWRRAARRDPPRRVRARLRRRSSGRSRSRTARRSSTRACSSSRSSASCPRRTSVSAARSRRSSATSSPTASSCATAREASVDGLPAGEGVFLPCSFWLVDCLELARAPRRRARAVRASHRARERRRPALGGVRPEGEAPARQLPAGVHASRPRELRLQRPAAPAVADAPATRGRLTARTTCRSSSPRRSIGEFSWL